MSYIPMVIEKEGRSERAYDLYSRMLKDFNVFLIGGVNSESANSIISQMLFLTSQDAERDINFYINSPGGEVYAGLGIYDTMQFISNKVNTICIGMAASMGAFLLSSGDHRMALPNATIMIHQPLGGAQGQATDIQIQANEIQRLKHDLNTILAKNTGKPYEEVVQDTERDNFLSVKDAIAYGPKGLIDEIINSKKSLG